MNVHAELLYTGKDSPLLPSLSWGNLNLRLGKFKFLIYMYLFQHKLTQLCLVYSIFVKLKFNV